MELESLFSSGLLNVQQPDFSASVIIRKLGAALIFGTWLSYIARWTHVGKKKKPRALLSMQHTHIFLCIGGAFVMIIIGNSLANAFGLTGALSMVRFRTNLINPKDAAILILIIAVGMGCGLNLFTPALIMTALTTALLLAMYLQGTHLKRQLSECDEEEE